MKITVIGGGSTYTPELFEGILESINKGTLPVSEVYLMDIDEDRLDVIGSLCRRMANKAGAGLEVVTGNDLAEAVEGAAFVLVQLRVGGNAARHQDILLGHRHGIIGQETTGIGGFAKALRTLPVMEKIVSEIRNSAPDAVLIDFTNPVSIITQYLTEYATDIRWAGLCNYPFNVLKDLAGMLEISDEKRIFLEYQGLNHLSFIRRVSLDGEDVTGRILDNYLEMGRMNNLPSDDFTAQLIRSTRLIPNPYLLYYYNTLPVLEKKIKAEKTRAEEVEEVEKELMELYKNPQLQEKPKALEKRGGAYYSTVAVRLMESFRNNTNDLHIVNVPNNGAISDLPDNVSVEVNCLVGADGAKPLQTGRLPEAVDCLIKQVKRYEKYTVRASVNKSYDDAFLALLNHPLIPDAVTAEAALDDLLETNKKFLPEFSRKGAV